MGHFEKGRVLSWPEVWINVNISLSCDKHVSKVQVQHQPGDHISWTYSPYQLIRELRQYINIWLIRLSCRTKAFYHSSHKMTKLRYKRTSRQWQRANITEVSTCRLSWEWPQWLDTYFVIWYETQQVGSPSWTGQSIIVQWDDPGCVVMGTTDMYTWLPCNFQNLQIKFNRYTNVHSCLEVK